MPREPSTSAAAERGDADAPVRSPARNLVLAAFGCLVALLGVVGAAALLPHTWIVRCDGRDELVIVGDSLVGSSSTANLVTRAGLRARVEHDSTDACDDRVWLGDASLDRVHGQPFCPASSAGWVTAINACLDGAAAPGQTWARRRDRELIAPLGIAGWLLSVAGIALVVMARRRAQKVEATRAPAPLPVR